MTALDLMVLKKDGWEVIDSENVLMHPIRLYLESIETQQSTKDEYERYIIYFFNYVFKDVFIIENITKEMIEGIVPTHINKYKKYLFSKDEKKNTVKKKINTVKFLYNYLLTNCKTNIDGGHQWLIFNPFDGIKIRISDEDVDHYDSCTPKEILKILEIANPQDKLLYEMAIRTGVRVTALLNIGLKDIQQKDGVWCIFGKDKGKKKFCEAITDKMYEEAFSLAKENDGKVFEMNRQTAHRRLKKYFQQIGLSDIEIKKRVLCFHSLKKSAVVIVGKMTNGNVTEMQKIGHHNDPKLTMSIYNKSIESKADSIGLKMDFSENSNEDLRDEIKSLSQEELMIKLFKCNNYILKEILSK